MFDYLFAVVRPLNKRRKEINKLKYKCLTKKEKEYSMRKRIAFFLACMLMSSLAFAQTKVTGTVVSVEDGEPIPGASIVIEGTKTGVVTDADGKFSMTVPADAKRLEVSCAGMLKQLVRVKPVINVELEVDNKTMDEVMVVAYGTSTKAAFTGSAAVVDNDKIEAVQSTNVLDALTGHVAGVELFNPTGNPTNNTPSIRIRGIGSLRGQDYNEPLIILDGTPYSLDLNTINTNDIESMTVLKDAAATSLYGARGANGVIVINTKSGKRGNGAKVTLDANWGSNSRAKRQYKTVKSPAQYYEMYHGALKSYAQDTYGLSDTQANLWANQNLTAANDYGLAMNVYNVPAGQFMIGQNGKLNPNAKLGNVVNYKGQDYMLTPDNWLDETYSNGLRQEYNVSVSDASERGSYLASFGYLNNEGIVVNSGLENITGRLKADLQAKKWLRVGANMSFTHYNTKGVTDDSGASNAAYNIFGASTQISPIYPMYIRDGQGNIMVDANGLRMYDWGDGRNAGISRPSQPSYNALQMQELDLRRGDGNAATASGFAEIRFLKDFKFTSTNTINLDETRSTSHTNPYFGFNANKNGIISKAHGRSLSYTFQQQLNWGHQYGKHDVGAMAGHEWYRSRSYYLSASKYNMFDPNNLELAGAITDNQTANSYTGDYNNEAYFLRGQYNYAQKYFLSASYRREASSRFSSEDGRWWGNFYSVGGAWVISEENFMKKASWIDFLKFKASYGEVGNDLIPSFLYTNRYSLENSSGHPSVVSSTTKGNKDITWEKLGEFNSGFEFQLFKARLNGSIEYFWRKTSDMLYYFSLPISSGFGGYYANIGDMVNHGVEVELDADLVRMKNFKWNVGLNMTHYKNKIKKMPAERLVNTVQDFDGKEYKGYANGNMFIGEGLSAGSFYMPRYAGVDQTTGKSLWWMDVTKYRDDLSKPILDDAGAPVLDADGNPTYEQEAYIAKETTDNYSNATDYVCHNLLPKLNGGINTRVELYGFDLSVDFAYQLGGYVYDSEYAHFMSSPLASSKGDNFHADLLKAWTAANPNSDIPRLQFGDTNSSSRSTRFLTKASYLSLQNLSFGYTLPANLTRKAKIDKVRVFMNATNVW